MTELLLSIVGFYFNEVTQVPAMSWLPHMKGIILPEGCCNQGAQETGKEFTKCLPCVAPLGVVIKSTHFESPLSHLGQVT